MLRQIWRYFIFCWFPDIVCARRLTKAVQIYLSRTCKLLNGMLKFKLSPWFSVLKIIFFWVTTGQLVKVEN
jgi:hypothetical protein